MPDLFSYSRYGNRQNLDKIAIFTLRTNIRYAAGRSMFDPVDIKIWVREQYLAGSSDSYIIEPSGTREDDRLILICRQDPRLRTEVIDNIEFEADSGRNFNIISAKPSGRGHFLQINAVQNPVA